MEHAFIVPAYRESPFLDECLRSIRAQHDASDVVITTSTPNQHIDETARRHRVPVIVAHHTPGIAADWNFALTATASPLVTVAHQDDVYRPTFTVATKAAFVRYPDANLTFTGFSEHDAQGPRKANANLLIKRALTRRAFGVSEALSDAGRKRRLLSLGNPVCCPSVTFNRSRVADFRFSGHFRSNLDWDAWERLAAYPGRFVYLREILVSHRVHPDTATSALIGNRVRDTEDHEMLGRFWPSTAARLLARIYRLSYAANRT